MGRRSKRPNAIPRLRERKQRDGRILYAYDHGVVDGKRKETFLGYDYGLALKKWAELEHDAPIPKPDVITLEYVGKVYLREYAPANKAARTVKDNEKEFAKLLEFFNDPAPVPMDAIKPKHVRMYMTWRSKSAPVRANREKALLSSIWNYGRDAGYTDLPNPCTGIKGNEEDGRDVYVEENEFAAVWAEADAPLQDAMDLAYLTGQRPADVLRWSDHDVRDGVIYVSQGKTRAKLRIEIEGELKALLARISARKSGYKIHSTRLIVSNAGKPFGVNWLSRKWRKATLDAIKKDARLSRLAEIQFRDLRAKAATDKTESADIRQAQRQLGHTSVVMTEAYVRARRGEKVKPTR